MSVEQLIDTYIASQPDQKRADLLVLHRFVTEAAPDSRLWFLDGTDEQGKTVSNPSIGYGERMLRHANGDTGAFYRVGSAPTARESRTRSSSPHCRSRDSRSAAIVTSQTDQNMTGLVWSCYRVRAVRSSRMSTRGKPSSTDSVSAALTNPARSNSRRVPTYAIVRSTFCPLLSTG